MPIVVPVLPPDTLIAYTRSIGLTSPATEKQEQAELPQIFADMHGGDELVDAVERAATSLSPEKRGRAVVLAENYGEAGALEVLGAERNLPRVICGHNNDWFWRPETIEGPVIALHRTREELEVWFEHVERVDTIHCRLCMPCQNNSEVHIARGLRVLFEEFWTSIKIFR